jgi:hypothetical protein
LRNDSPDVRAAIPSETGRAAGDDRENTQRVSSFAHRREEAHHEYLRIFLTSLAATAEAELRERRARRLRLRARRAERRLAELRLALAELDAPTDTDHSADSRRGNRLRAAVTPLLIVSSIALAALLIISGIDATATAVANVAMLLLGLLWFLLPVLRPADRQ